jgi:hypothetical protein
VPHEATAVIALPVSGHEWTGMDGQGEVRSSPRNGLFIMRRGLRRLHTTEAGTEKHTECECRDNERNEYLKQGEAILC